MTLGVLTKGENHTPPVLQTIHGKGDWKRYWGDVGYVPHPPKKMLTDLNGPCPIANRDNRVDGPKMIDTHVVVWIPQTINNEPLAINIIEKIARSHIFGDHKTGFSAIDEKIRDTTKLKTAVYFGHWVAMYKWPIQAGKTAEQQIKFITDHCQGYYVPRIRDVIVCSFMTYVCSNEKNERLLSIKLPVHFSLCRDKIDGLHMIVGAFETSGIKVLTLPTYTGQDALGVCPLRRYFPSHTAHPESVEGGFDPTTGSEMLHESSLQKMAKDTFWDSLIKLDPIKLIISCNDSREVIYEKGFLNRLLETKPDLVDLTENFTVTFPGGEEVQETKARLLMCGDTFRCIINCNTVEQSTRRIVMNMVSFTSFQDVLKAIETNEYDLSVYSDDVQTAMSFLTFPFQLPKGVHGKKDWKQYWGDVGDVPLPPNWLLESIEGPCPFSNAEKNPEGPMMIDTHIVLWMPPTINGKPLTYNSIEMISQSDQFGDNKIGYESIHHAFRTAKDYNRPIKTGYWLAMYKQPIEAGKSFDEQDQFIAQNFPKYTLPTSREVVVSCFMHYVCSGDKKERILPRENAVRGTRCEESGDVMNIVVGSFALSGIKVINTSMSQTLPSLGVCPVRRK